MLSLSPFKYFKIWQNISCSIEMKHADVEAINQRNY